MWEMYKVGQILGRALTASLIAYFILWIASNIFYLAFPFLPFFGVCFIIAFIFWY
jgi:hypothetical protein